MRGISSWSFDSIERKVDNLEHKLYWIEERISYLETKIGELESKFQYLEEAVGNIEMRMDGQLNSLEERISKLEGGE